MAEYLDSRSGRYYNILGLGRCSIGLLRKNLLDICPSLTVNNRPISFDHKYILNPFTCLHKGTDRDAITSLFELDSKPSISEQVDCLTNIQNYQIVLLELFPPSFLYKHTTTNIYCCFESYTSDLSNAGFVPVAPAATPSKNHSLDTYIKNLKSLINVIVKENRKRPLILLNSELLYGENKEKLSSPLIHQIVDWVKKDILHTCENIHLFDINELLSTLSKKRLGFFDTEFPLHYIRHTPALKPIAFARDCKHASKNLRAQFTLHFLHLLESIGNNVSGYSVTSAYREILPETKRDRGIQFLEFFNTRYKSNQLISDFKGHFEDSRVLSRYIDYTLEYDNPYPKLILKEYIASCACLYVESGRSLIDYLYHIRSLCAYYYVSKEPLADHFCSIALKVLSLPETTQTRFITYTLLWIKNIFLALQYTLDSSILNKEFPLTRLFDKLQHASHLHDHELIQTILSYDFRLQKETKDFCFLNWHQTSRISESDDSFSVSSSARQNKLNRKSQRIGKIAIRKNQNRLGLFLPQPTPFYIALYNSMKKGFELAGFEVKGQPQLLGRCELLEFCDAFKPDIIFEMNRSRAQTPFLPRQIKHIAWIVDLLGHTFEYFKESEIIYLFCSQWISKYNEAWEEANGVSPPSLIEWLPPGYCPETYYPQPRPEKTDFSFIGHIPLPWNNDELNRVIYKKNDKSFSFADFCEYYSDENNYSDFFRYGLDTALSRMLGTQARLSDRILRYDMECRISRISQRRTLIDAVLSTSKSLSLYGPQNWKHWPQYRPYYIKFIDDPNEIRRAYQSSRINLHEGVSAHFRAFDIFGSGGCLFYYRNPHRLNGDKKNALELFMEPGVHYIPFEPSDISEKSRYFLENDEKRRNIGKEAQKIVFNCHKWVDRAQKIVGDLNSL